MAKQSKIDSFVKEYILKGCKDGTQAAINAGYSERTAPQQASRLLKNVNVLAAIKQYQKADLKLFIKSKEQKLQMLEEIAKACMTVDDDKGMVNAPAAISAIKEHNAMQGDNAPIETINSTTVKSFSDMYGNS
jgi:phage terminase small subunit